MSRPPRSLQAAVLALVLLADRATKVWALRWLSSHSPVRVAPFFHLTYVKNTGAAFGMLQGANAFFIGVSAVLLAGLAWMLRRLGEDQRGARLSALLVAAGALGNLYDRLAYGHVIDFLDFRVWPVFNVADSCICVGAVLLAFLLGREPKQEGRPKGAP